VIEQADVVISALGNSDKLLFSDVGSRVVLRMAFDDLSCSSENLFAPNRKQIADLIEFAAGFQKNFSCLMKTVRFKARKVPLILRF